MNSNPDRDFDRQGPGPAPTETEHARLCAYLLGELPAVEREGMARALQTDPALAAEAERIRATLDMVSAAFPDIANAPEEYALSADRRRALLAAATHAKRGARAISWWPSLAAAVIALAAVGLYHGSGTAPEVRREPDMHAAIRELAEPAPTRAPNSEESSQTAKDGRFQPPTDLDQVGAGARDAVLGLSAGASVDATTPVELTDVPLTTHSRVQDLLDDTVAGTVFIGAVTAVPDEVALDLHAITTNPGKPAEAGELLRRAGSDPVIGSVGRSPVLRAMTAMQGLPAPSTATITPAAGLSQKLDLPAVLRMSEAIVVPDDPALAPIVNTGVIYETRDFDVEVANGAVLADIPDLTLDPDALIEHCRRRPNESPTMMFFRFWGDHPFVRTARDPVSTFSADVDTASYALARRYLTSGLIPEKAAIRTEEFLNYFRADVPAPVGHDVFRVHLEGAKSLFGGAANDRYLLRVTLRGRDAGAADRPTHRLTFVVDTSGSMKEQNRMELVKHGLRLLVGELTERDQISIVAFNANAQLILPMTSVLHRGVIEAAIHGLTPDGSTNAEAGLKLGYEVAATALHEAATSRVILLSDGVANVGQTDQDRINGDVKNRREQGIYLNTIGVGLGNHNDVFLEQLADQGDGICNYIDSEKEAQRALVENFTGALVTIARDVKIQVEFDPAIIGSYRQLGYENRAVADHDFRNDHVDAGEVGAGHQVTALYEVEPLVDLRSTSAPPGTVRVRYKAPFGGAHRDAATAADGDEVEVASAGTAEGATEIEASFTADHLSLDYAQASTGYRRATLVAEFAELLRRSIHARDGSLDLLYHEATLLDATLKDPDFTEFCELVSASRQIIAARPVADDPLSQSIDAVRRNAILRAELEDLAHERDAAVLDQIERENKQLEDRIRELLRARSDGKDRR